MNSGVSILIAEDDENDRFLMQWALEKARFQGATTFASDGQEMIELLEKWTPPAGVGIHPIMLFLDIRMPRMNGFQVLQWLQQHPASRPERVLILSSSSDPMDMEQARALGADDYKVKPHDLSGYVKMVNDFKDQMSGTTP